VYWVAQLAGALAAAALLRGSLGDIAHVGATLPSGSNLQSLLWEIVLSAILMFVMSFMMGGQVNNWAHAGGFAGGWITAQVMPIEAQKREGRLVMIVALLLALATLAGFVLSFLEVTGVLLRSRG